MSAHDDGKEPGAGDGFPPAHPPDPSQGEAEPRQRTPGAEVGDP